MLFHMDALDNYAHVNSKFVSGVHLLPSKLSVLFIEKKELSTTNPIEIEALRVSSLQ